MTKIIKKTIIQVIAFFMVGVKEIQIKNQKFIPPTLEEIKAYCKERNNNKGF